MVAHGSQEATLATKFLTPKVVCEFTSLSRATLDRLVSAGAFPQPIRITERRLAFEAEAVEAWMREKVAAA
jgi:predicted DNA-binding transcriptional regulator AlpA